MTEFDWYEKTEALLHEAPRGDWNRIVSRAVEVHRYYKLDEDKSDQQVAEALHGLLRKLQGYPPTWLAIAGPDGEIATPDDIWIEPAWSVVEVQRLWDEHDGRSHGTLIVGVYLWSMENRAWVRDRNFGVMGNEGKRGYADESDRIC